MPGPFHIQLVENYFGVPILEAGCKEPTLLTAQADAQMARSLLEQPYPKMAVVVDYGKLSYAADYGPEQEAEAHRHEPFLELGERTVAVVRYHAGSLTSLIYGMRVNMMLRHARHANFAPDLDTAVRFARRAIDRARVPTV